MSGLSLGTCTIHDCRRKIALVIDTNRFKYNVLYENWVILTIKKHLKDVIHMSAYYFVSLLYLSLHPPYLPIIDAWLVPAINQSLTGLSIVKQLQSTNDFFIRSSTWLFLKEVWLSPTHWKCHVSHGRSRTWFDRVFSSDVGHNIHCCVWNPFSMTVCFGLLG